jgi:hypothetical protein
MKEDLQRLKQIRDAVVGIEMQLNLVESDLVEVSSSLDFLRKLESDLVFNIYILRRDGIVAVASEYKKSIEELKTTRHNIVAYTRKKRILNQKFDRYLRLFSDHQQEYSKLLRTLENTKVVLRFDQSKRRIK